MIIMFKIIILPYLEVKHKYKETEQKRVLEEHTKNKITSVLGKEVNLYLTSC